MYIITHMNTHTHRSCSNFKQILIPFYKYDSWWVCSKAFRFIIK